MVCTISCITQCRTYPYLKERWIYHHPVFHLPLYFQPRLLRLDLCCNRWPLSHAPLCICSLVHIRWPTKDNPLSGYGDHSVSVVIWNYLSTDGRFRQLLMQGFSPHQEYLTCVVARKYLLPFSKFCWAPVDWHRFDTIQLHGLSSSSRRSFSSLEPLTKKLL